MSVADQQMCSEQVFLDSDNLRNLNDLFSAVQKSDSLVLLYTDHVLSRPWCLLELDVALKAEIPIIVVQLANSYRGDSQQFEETLKTLPQYLAKENPTAVDMLCKTPYLVDIKSLGERILAACKSSQFIDFDPHASSMRIQGQIRELTGSIVAKACPENESLLQDLTPLKPQPWIPIRRLALFIIYSDSDSIACQAAGDIQQWLYVRCGLEQSTVELGANHLEGASSDIITASDLVAVADETDAVILIQTGSVLSDARPLAQVYTAVRNHVPIVPIKLVSARKEDEAMIYSFEESLRVMEHMEEQLSSDVRAAVSAATQQQDITAIGKELLRAVPNIISKQLAVDTGAARAEVQMQEIEADLRIATRHSGTQRLPKLKLSEGLPGTSQEPKPRYEP